MNEIDNSLSEYFYAVGKDCPGKTWFEADLNRAPIYRALQINPQDPGAAYAVVPFRLARIDGRWLILAAYPAPKVFSVEPWPWYGIETVIAWEPNSDKAHVLEDPSPQLVGRLTEDAATIYASPRAFFQAWAIRRAQFEGQRQHVQSKAWTVTPTERDDTPGALVVGNIAKIHFSPSIMPEHIECQGFDPQVLNKAIMRAARLPRVSAAQHVRRAA